MEGNTSQARAASKERGPVADPAVNAVATLMLIVTAIIVLTRPTSSSARSPSDPKPIDC
jgi:hypothetical protein